MMSAPNYRYGHKSGKRRPRKALLILASSVLLVGLVVGAIALDLRSHVSPEIQGESRVISQVLSDNSQVKTIDEPFFRLELPADWKETGRNQNNLYDSISWQAGIKGQDNRFLTVYVDRIPLDYPLNRLLPVRSQGNEISFSDLSDKCETFTAGGTTNANQAASLPPTLSKWREVDFMCNLPRFTDNEVGTGTPGSKNAVTVTGPVQGTHKYFFVYTDRSFQPDYSILFDALRSFRAK
jgi:hypothetical protein